MRLVSQVEGAASRVRLRRNVGLAAAMVVMNLAAYGFNIVASPWLGPRGYGAVAAIISVLMVINVVALGLQATAARRVAAHPEAAAAIEREMLRTTYLASAGVGLLCLALAPVLDRLLNLDSLATAALIAVAAAPLTVMGGQAGLLQGEERWLLLSLVYLAFGLGRLVAGVAVLIVRPDPFGAALGIAIGAFAPMIVGALALRHRRDPVASEDAGVPASRTLREILTSSQALLAFLALASVDILLARAVLDDHLAGLYAGGLIITKAVLFLPQFVILIAFPAMSRDTVGSRAHRLGLALIGGMGVLAVLGVVIAGLIEVPAPGGERVALSVLFIGGPEYASLEPRLWLWALLGTLLAVVQLLVYAVLARQQSASVTVIWAALVLTLVVGPFVVSGPTSLLTLMLLVDGVVLGVLLALGRRSVSGLVPAPTGADRDVQRHGE